MARVGIFEKPPRKYFKYDTDTEVELEFIDKKTLDAVIKSANEAAQKVKTPQGMVYDMFLGKKAVHNWRRINDHTHPGLLLPNGEAIAFTSANRNMMMTGSRDFSEFVFRNATNATGFLDDEPAGQVGQVDDPATLEALLEGMDGADDVKN
jgi:hypothetical protein